MCGSKNTNVTLSNGTTVNGVNYGIYTDDASNENNIINIDSSSVSSSTGNGVALVAVTR
jgi:hypothetical protein